MIVGVLLLHKRRHGNTAGRGQACRTCGNPIPEGALFCQKCGAPSLIESQPEQVTALEDRVYEYIIKHEGVISMSTAARDLGLTLNQLKEVTEKLKSEGRLS
jgi:predicted amidophosphoribosyltransferase